MICCIPWSFWRSEIKLLPVSSQTLFANRGIEIEKLEDELKLEGYLHQNDVLLNILGNEKNLVITLVINDPTDNWTEEDFIYAEEQRKLIKTLF